MSPLRTTVPAILIALLALGVAKADTPPSPAETPAIPASVAEEKLVPLTRDGALLSAMLHNRAVEVARFGPRIAGTYVPEARAAFDPVLAATASYGRDTRPDLVTGLQTSTSGGTGSGATATDDVARAATLVSALARLNRAVYALDPEDIRTKQSGASVSLRNRLPTGATLFITGMTNLNDVDPGADLNTGDLAVGINQPLLRGLGLKANLVALHQARNLAEQSEHAFRRALLSTAREVELGYWQLVLAVELLKIREFALTLANEQVKRTQGFLDVGKAIRGDVMATQAEAASRRAELAGALGDLRNRNLDLLRLMNPDNAPDYTALFAPQDPADAAAIETNGDASAALARENRPEMAEAALDVANLDLDVVRERNNRLPRLDLVGGYGRYSAGHSAGDATNSLRSDDYDHYNVGIEFEMPLMRRAEKARLARAKYASERGDAAVRDLADAVGTEARQAVVTVQQQWDRLAATREAVASRTEELRIAQGRYEVGKVTNLDVLQVQRDLIQSQVDDVTARVGYIAALTRLYAAEGTLLNRRGIAAEQYAEEK